jgi:hypothetical protein
MALWWWAVARKRVDATLKSFGRWAPTARMSGEPDADTRELRLLLDLLHDYVGVDDPARLRPGDIGELLLRVYPRKITVLDAEDIGDTIPAMRDLLAFLADTGAVTKEVAERLTRELDEVAPQFTSAVMDPENWGMARTLTQAMASDGVDFGDQGAVDRWITRYNARLGGDAVGDEDPFGDLDEDDTEDFVLKDAFGLPDRLPPVRLPPEGELAAMSRTSPLLSRARRLAYWAGTGRPISRDGELTAGDTVVAARELGIEVPLAAAVRPKPATSSKGGPKDLARSAGQGDRRDDAVPDTLPGMAAQPAVKSMRNVPELARLWSIALDAGFVDVDGGARAEPGEAMTLWPGGTDEDVLDIWCAGLGSVLELLELDSALDARRAAQLDFDGAGVALMLMLFLARGEGMPVGEASDMIRETASAELLPVPAAKAWHSWIKAHGDPAEALLGQLADLGAVSVVGDEPGEGQVARLTPLAMWAMREQLIDEGVEVPLLPPVTEMTAADLIAASEGAAEAEIAAETAAWLELRTPDTAARELLAVAASGGAVARMLAVSVINRLGAAAEPAWRESLGRLELRPYAKIALTEIAGGSPGKTVPGLEPDADDVAWVLTDMLAAISLDSPEELPQQLAEAVPSGLVQQVFDAMALSSHPDAASALSLVGKHHPDKRIAKAARKSAYRAGGRPRTS